MLNQYVVVLLATRLSSFSVVFCSISFKLPPIFKPYALMYSPCEDVDKLGAG